MQEDLYARCAHCGNPITCCQVQNIFPAYDLLDFLKVIVLDFESSITEAARSTFPEKKTLGLLHFEDLRSRYFENTVPMKK